MKTLLVLTVLALFVLSAIAQAVVIDTVPVGDTGNAPDLRYAGGYYQNPTGYGAVSYTYNIGKYEVTAAQYTAFLNAKAKTDTYGLYNTNMDTAVYSYGCNIKRTGTSGNFSYAVASDWANRPVNFVSVLDGYRFANWLGNGQGNGDTETGAYTLSEIGNWYGYGRTVQRNSGATWLIPSEDEWYKAAYYKGGGIDAGYWDYPTQSNSLPSNSLANPDPGNSANYWIGNYTIGSPYWRTNVGEFVNSPSAYGTYDQGGNVSERNEAVIILAHFPDDPRQDVLAEGLRGGSFHGYDHTSRLGLAAGERFGMDYPPDAGFETDEYGFRVVGIPGGWQPVPEPSSVLVLGSGILALAGMIRRRR